MSGMDRAYLIRMARKSIVQTAANGKDTAYVPCGQIAPEYWEEVRVEMQSRLRLFTGEPDAILHFEFPGKGAL